MDKTQIISSARQLLVLIPTDPNAISTAADLALAELNSRAPKLDSVDVTFNANDRSYILVNPDIAIQPRRLWLPYDPAQPPTWQPYIYDGQILYLTGDYVPAEETEGRLWLVSTWRFDTLDPTAARAVIYATAAEVLNSYRASQMQLSLNLETSRLIQRAQQLHNDYRAQAEQALTASLRTVSTPEFGGFVSWSQHP